MNFSDNGYSMGIRGTFKVLEWSHKYQPWNRHDIVSKEKVVLISLTINQARGCEEDHI